MVRPVRPISAPRFVGQRTACSGRTKNGATYFAIALLAVESAKWCDPTVPIAPSDVRTGAGNQDVREAVAD